MVVLSLLPEPTMLAAFLIGAVALILAPGPDTFYVAARSLTQGRTAGLLASLGISGGLAVHVAAAAFGLASLFHHWPLAFDIVRYAGVAYLGYLAWRALVEPEIVPQSPAALTPQGAMRIVRQAVLTNVFNPKVALFFVAFLPQFAAPDRGAVGLQIALLGLLFISMGLAYLLVVALTAGVIGEFLRRHPAWRRGQRWLLASSLGGLAVWLALPGRR